MLKKNHPFSDKPLVKQSPSEIAKSYNLKLYDHLQLGNTINFLQSREFGVTRLDAQIAEIRKVTHVYSREIRINRGKFMEYSFQPFV